MSLRLDHAPGFDRHLTIWYTEGDQEPGATKKLLAAVSQNPNFRRVGVVSAGVAAAYLLYSRIWRAFRTFFWSAVPVSLCCEIGFLLLMKITNDGANDTSKSASPFKRS